jgi:hypothetical protein
MRALALAAFGLAALGQPATADAPPPAQFVDPCVRGAGPTCTRALDGFFAARPAGPAARSASPGSATRCRPTTSWRNTSAMR